MKKWTWTLILIGVAVLLFVWSIRREGFQETSSLHGPPYGGCVKDNTTGECIGLDDYVVIKGMMPNALVKALETANGATNPDQPRNPSPNDTARYNADRLAYYRKLVDGTISDTMGEFYRKVYEPASKTLTGEDVDKFIKDYLAQIQLSSPSAYKLINDNKGDVKTLLVSYFVTQEHGEANAELTAAQRASAAHARESGYEATLADVGQGVGSSSKSEKDLCKDEVAANEWDKVSEKCKKLVSNANGNSTGGSTTTASSTAGGTNFSDGVHKGNIWGPAYTGMGDNAGSGLGGGSRDYPTLLGPEPKESVMVEGAGIAPPSIHSTLAKKGGLPSSGSTGSDEQSKFFGASRLPATGGASTVPGDQDMYPGYFGGAGSTAFTASSGSSKTDPVPFLADFSAFTK